jgi:hypothetical protein
LKAVCALGFTEYKTSTYLFCAAAWPKALKYTYRLGFFRRSGLAKRINIHRD